MTIAGFNRLQLLGSIGTSEIWSCGFNFASTAGEAGADTQAGLAVWAAAIKGLRNGAIIGATMQSFLGSNFSLTGFKLSAVSGTTFKEGAIAQVALGAPIVGNGAPVQAQEVACAASLLTGFPGKQYRGRVYWPASGRAVNASCRFFNVDVDGLGSDIASFLHSVAQASTTQDTGANPAPAGGVVEPVVISRVHGLATPITQVSVGDVPDVQRRRRNHEQEVYTVHPVTQ